MAQEEIADFYFETAADRTATGSVGGVEAIGKLVYQKSDGSLYRVSAVSSTRVPSFTSVGIGGSKIAKVSLVASDAAGGFLTWQNPESSSILVKRVILHVTTAATAACTVDIGGTGTSAATSADNLIDGLDINAATGYFDNTINGGTAGKGAIKVDAGKWVTGSKASGAAAGVVGSAWIEYILY